MFVQQALLELSQLSQPLLTPPFRVSFHHSPVPDYGHLQQVVPLGAFCLRACFIARLLSQYSALLLEYTSDSIFVQHCTSLRGQACLGMFQWKQPSYNACAYDWMHAVLLCVCVWGGDVYSCLLYTHIIFLYRKAETFFCVQHNHVIYEAKRASVWVFDHQCEWVPN